jgi:hypothetical protein
LAGRWRVVHFLTEAIVVKYRHRFDRIHARDIGVLNPDEAVAIRRFGQHMENVASGFPFRCADATIHKPRTPRWTIDILPTPCERFGTVGII